jgi:hypothetical protein
MKFSLAINEDGVTIAALNESGELRILDDDALAIS